MSEAVSMSFIGHVASDIVEQTDERWGQVTSRIEVLPPYWQGLIGLDQFSHVIVVTFL